MVGGFLGFNAECVLLQELPKVVCEVEEIITFLGILHCGAVDPAQARTIHVRPCQPGKNNGSGQPKNAQANSCLMVVDGMVFQLAGTSIFTRPAPESLQDLIFFFPHYKHSKSSHDGAIIPIARVCVCPYVANTTFE